MVNRTIMERTSSRGRGGKAAGAGKRHGKGSAESDSRRSSRISLVNSAKPLSPAASIASNPEPAKRATQPESESVVEEIAPEIVVWTEDMDTMSVGSPEPPPTLDVPREGPSQTTPTEPVTPDVPTEDMEDVM